MSDKTAERPAKAGKAQRAREETLDKDLRELYEKYGEGKVPQHLIDLAKQVDAARRGEGTQAAGTDAAKAPTKPKIRE